MKQIQKFTPKDLKPETAAGKALNGNQAEMYKRERLTGRETEVLALVARGFTAKEIGVELIVSLNTVETHRKNIIQKLKARNIAQAVAVAVKRKLI